MAKQPKHNQFGKYRRQTVGHRDRDRWPLYIHGYNRKRAPVEIVLSSADFDDLIFQGQRLRHDIRRGRK